jgi:hypothetical protein
MGIVGNLRTMQLEELLQWLSLSKKTGTLEINGEKITKKIFFQEGLIVASASNRPEEFLGHFLVSHGLINEATLAKSIELQEMTGTLLGKILVTREAISEADLHRMLQLKTEESIYEIFQWEAGDFRFLDNEILPESAMVPMALDVTGILMEGVQRVDEFRRIRKLIPNVHAIPVQIAEWNQEDLDAGERQILDLVNDERTIEEIRLQTHSSDFHVCRVLYRQWQEGRLKVVKARGRDAAGAATVVNGPVTGQTLREAGQKLLGQTEFEHALRHLRAARSLDPDDPDIQDALIQAEKVVRVEIEKSGVTLVSIPQLSVALDQLTNSKLSPHEGFMLTRINGSYDIQSILKITPMPQLDALLVFWKLLKEGFIRMTAKK